MIGDVLVLQEAMARDSATAAKSFARVRSALFGIGFPMSAC
jgi:hypothetical protein